METRSENPIEKLPDEGLRPFSYWQIKALKMLRAWRTGEEGSGYRTGLDALDAYIRLVPGEVTILGARPGMGKTAFAVQVAMSIVPERGDNRRVAIFSAEMSGWSLYMRVACAIAAVPMFSLRSRSALDVDYDLVETAIRRLATYPLLVDDRSRPDTLYMRKELDIMAGTYNVLALIFDFMELSGDTGVNQEQRLSNAMMNLKSIAKDYNIPILALSHLSREVESRADKFPQLDDLRYSGMIEQLADQVLLMTRPKYYLDKGIKIDLRGYDGFDGVPPITVDTAYVVVAKNRNGNTGIVRLGFDGANMRFYDINRIDLNKGLA